MPRELEDPSMEVVTLLPTPAVVVAGTDLSGVIEEIGDDWLKKFCSVLSVKTYISFCYNFHHNCKQVISHVKKCNF